MTHRHHLICFAAAVGLGMWLMFVGNGASTLAGVGLAALICPLVMGAVMWMLMRPQRPASNRIDPVGHDEHISEGSR